jgi:two-component system CheB/CheR fusion protein
MDRPRQDPAGGGETADDSPIADSDSGSGAALRSAADPSGAPAAIVAVGASAGGLAALKQLFAHVPRDSDLAFVIVVHLSPDHESHLELLLQPHVRVPVQQVTQTVRIEKNHVYVIPPNANLDAIDTHLRLTDLEKRRQERAPIDHFFRTLAKTHDRQAVGVVLTGTGSDGSLGLRRIKERGGLTIVQDPKEAEFDGMPQSAIATALVDMVLPLAKIPEAILRFIRTEPRLRVTSEVDDQDSEARAFLQKVLAQVRVRTGRDLSHYKRSTLLRRITRRMQFNHIQEPASYVDLLRKQVDEVRALADDLLITVTSFFRDPEVFETLERRVIPLLFQGKRQEDSVRVWCVACATGEEAYSLAILLLEEAARHQEPPSIQIFASDLHYPSLEKARDGFYPGDIEAQVKPERLRRFFQKESGGYRVRKEVRELVIFAPHNLLADPPFSRLNLVSCRNLLIYFDNELQRQVAELFHYALQQDGFLLLGSSETIDGTDLFLIEDKKRGLFAKRNVPALEPRLPVFPVNRTRAAEGGRRVDVSREPMTYATVHQQMLELHGPPSALVSPDDNVLHFSGRAGRYFVQPSGVPTTALFKLLREELRVELRAVLPSVREHGRMVRTAPVAVRFDDATAAVGVVTIDVRPAVEPDRAGYALLLFEEQALREPRVLAGSETGEQAFEGADTARQRELDTDKRLQSIIEAYEVSQEEIKASNEELQSANEELRSTLEELETSKEELQSMNEELQTVNQENRHKVEELGQLTSDLQNLLAATDIATLFLDRETRILRFTPKIAELFNIRMIDRGRPLSDLTHRLGYDALQQDVADVLARLVPVEREVQDQSGRWYLTRILPYRSAEDRIAGTVVTFIEITQRKASEDALRHAKDYSEQVIEALPEPLLILSTDHIVHSANAAFYAHFQLAEREAKGRRVYDLGPEWDTPALHALLDERLGVHGTFKGHTLTHVRSDGSRRVLLMNGRRLDALGLLLLGIHDVTDLSEAEKAVREGAERLSRMVNVEGVGVLLFDPAGKLIDANDAFLNMFRYSRADIVAGLLSRGSLTSLEYAAVDARELKNLELTGRIGPYEVECSRSDGSRSWMLFAGAALGDGTVVEYCIDVSDRRRAEQALRESELQLAAELAAMQRLHDLVGRLFVCPDLEAALQEVLAAAIQIAGATMGNIQLFDPERNTLEIAAQQGFDRAFLEEFRDVDQADETAWGRALRCGKRVIVEDVEAEPGYEPFRAAAAAAGYRGVQSTPLSSRDGSLLGILSTHYPQPYAPSERDLRLLDLYARQAADFIDRKRADEALRLSETRLGEENRHKDEYLAMLGHELRNPLAAIRSATEILVGSEVTEPHLNRARSVLVRQSAHMSRIIDGLLEVSRIVRGKVTLELETVDVRQVVERVLSDRAEAIAARGLTLHESLPPEPAWVMGDEVRLVQVFDNLLSNALKFTHPPGAITVEVEVTDEAVAIRVRDTGVGMRPEVLSRIFRAFHQETQDVARSAGGLGLGLALARGLVELHDGSIRARSEGPGKGAEFEVRLPRRTPGDSQLPEAPSVALSPQRILLVEDNADAAEMLRELLQQRGHTVTIAPTGSSALELLRNISVDAILCDLGLPGMSGYDVARAVRSDGPHRLTPMFAVTGYSQREDRKRSAEAGFDGHLVKPVTLRAIEALLAQFSTRRAGAEVRDGAEGAS